MEYNKVIAVTGLPGLYELLSSKSDGAIVRALDDKTTRFVSNRIHNFSHLESIEVYTIRDNVNLVDILKAMETSKEKLPDEKDNAALKGYFSKVFPDLDFDRVYSSDLKKMVKWFTVLKANNIEIKLSEAAPEDESAEVEEVVAEEKPAPKKKAEKAEEKPAEKPKKVEAKVKSEEAAEEKPKAKKAAVKANDEAKVDSTEETPKAAAPKKKAEGPAKAKEAEGTKDSPEEKPKKAAKKKS
ncbi:MAG TPA: DUF5606 domain-containing protein [Puia sp.]|jgi:hypothetical protein|nr:DUF5606 domain-containing protein [Puia sp.]